MNVKVIIIALILGLSAALGTHISWHLYVDHQTFHDLLGAVIQQQRANQNGQSK